ncbi:response regulator transcription factor [Marmoricola sp. RAF53]|uniref:response regulator transcription factor n=1 Tax=Marmoricola sp. RAF53 TaxID=3233059 RepID=UPI003F9EA772
MRVLLVEDETPLAAALQEGLKREGHTADVACDGAEGLWYAEENEYDVIVLDLMLPVVNGFQVCRRLRELDDWTPVLMLTARDGDRDMVEGLDAGADDYVTKPFSFEVLLARLRSLARRNVTERPTVMRVSDLEMDPASRRASRQGDELVLTTREFAVLEMLMRNKGAVVSKQQLLGAIWGFDFDGDPNILEVYIGRLRRKVDKPYDVDSIETVRGSGYRLRVEP